MHFTMNPSIYIHITVSKYPTPNNSYLVLPWTWINQSKKKKERKSQMVLKKLPMLYIYRQNHFQL